MHYGYSEYTPCRKEDVLRRISQEEIYKLVLEELPEPNKYIKSPFRKDKTPGSFFYWYNGILYFKDFGDPHRDVRDCFQVVMDKLGFNFKQTLLYINQHFKLGLDSSNAIPAIYEDIFIDNKINKSIIGKLHHINHKPSNEIEYKPRPLLPIDKKFWYDRYEINKQQLVEDNVFGTIWYKFYSNKGKLITIRPADICYAYSDFLELRTKIYRPFISGVGKWTTNCTNNDIGGHNRLALKGDLLIITKSYKDYRVIKNQGYDVVWFQNEGMFPDDEILIDYCMRFKRIAIIFDNDEKGIIAATKLVNKINDLYSKKSKSFIIAQRQIKIKDSSDLQYHYGKIELAKFLYQIKHHGK